MTTLNSNVRELLASILDVLDVPPPTRTDDDAYRRLLETRAGIVRCSIRALLTEEQPDMRFDAAFIRKGIARYPATYPVCEVTAPAGKDTRDAAQAPAGESTQPDVAPQPHDDPALPPQLREALRIMGRRGPVVELTGCADITTAEHGQAAPPPGPAAELPGWVYRAERTEAPRPMCSYGTRPADAAVQLADLAAEVAARVRIEHAYRGLITVWVWPQRADEHYRQPVPDHAERFLYPAGQPTAGGAR